MRRFVLFGLCILALLAVGASWPSTRDFQQTGAELATAALRHIEELSSLGVRTAGSKNEAHALAYINKEFKKMGLNTDTEAFSFLTYSLQKLRFRIGDREAEPEFAAFDVYGRPEGDSGTAVFIDPQISREDLFKLDLVDKIAVTARPANRFGLAFKKPKALIFLQAEDFRALREASGQTAALEAEGRVEKMTSANLVADLPTGSSSRQRVLVSAHYDAAGGPGASDNASGVAVMLEVARYFRERKQAPVCQLQFVALGAEEVGQVGSRIFVDRHGRALADCELVFNIDTVGGGGDIYIEMRGGVSGISSRKGESQIPPELADKAETDIGGRWGYLEPRLLAPFAASCVPDWLKQEINTAATELGIAFTPANNMGSDHLVFAHAGIPATNIAAAGGEIHGPADRPDKVSRQGLERAAAIVIRVVEKTMERIRTGPMEPTAIARVYLR